MMTSFFTSKGGKEPVTTKTLKQAESPTCIKNRTFFASSWPFHDLKLHNTVLSLYSAGCQRLILAYYLASYMYCYKGTVVGSS